MTVASNYFVDNGRFKLIYNSKNHHYIWRETDSGALVISDHSADDMYGSPTSVRGTDDGVLYVDVEKIWERGGLCVCTYEHRGKLSVFVPLFKKTNMGIGTSSLITSLPVVVKLFTLPEFEGSNNLLFNLLGDSPVPLKVD